MDFRSYIEYLRAIIDYQLYSRSVLLIRAGRVIFACWFDLNVVYFYSDQGMNSTSRVTRELCKVVGVQQSHTTHTILMGNGMAERFNQMLIRMISILDDKQNKDWTIQIISLVHAYNTTKHESICYMFSFWCLADTRLCRLTHIYVSISKLQKNRTVMAIIRRSLKNG